ncbi:glycoside hydrolase family 2 TIM barrel-domain containing protein [Cohnella nanjingensis]|uniref:glycoside hydrolase family 2 TIM barrel-domain containing protein n=1 Tax=Cohnella nanjingensis TaxID=1387779 RepID=UPI001FEA5287|nr:glycoside hydrolase family 2 TIM barrel-domain containing protein [Cohnella nanjingensis]
MGNGQSPGKKKVWRWMAAAIVAGGGIILAIQQQGIRGGQEARAALNPIPHTSQEGFLQTTFSLQAIDGTQVPFQNGLPVPSFEPQRRKTVPLSGEWEKRRFEADHGFSMQPRTEAWLAELEKREADYLAGESRAEWEPKTLPAPENRLTGEAAANAAETFEDGVWYRRTFLVDGYSRDRAYTLKSLGVNYVSDFWINGHWIGYHEGGFTLFAFDVSPFLREGDNEIRVRVDNPPWGSRDDIIPAVAGTDFFNYTGILQDLYVEETDAAQIARADIVPRSTDGKLDIRVVVANRGDKPRNVALKGAIYEADPKSAAYWTSPEASGIRGAAAATDRPIESVVALKPGEARVLSYQVQVAEPKLWSMRTPNLYVASFELSDAEGAGAGGGDRFDTQFGIRTLGTKQANILLNGKPTFLAGIARHEEWPDTGRTAAWDRILADLRQIQAQHANMVRTGHYPNQVYTYLALDRLGLAAMSEIPLWQFETAHYRIQEERRFADQMWREMVFSQYNRPSVLLWSTQNESKEVALRLTYNERLVNDLRTNYDDGRLITQSAAADQPGPEDPSMAPLDVAGWTMYFGIFHGSTYYEGTRQFLEKAHEAYPDKPILNTEFGHWTGDGDAEAPAQSQTYEETMQAMMEKATLSPAGTASPNGFVAGVDFWIMYDWYVNHNQWIDTFGAYRMDRKQAKPVAAAIAADYARLTALGGEASGDGRPSATLWTRGDGNPKSGSPDGGGRDGGSPDGGSPEGGSPKSSSREGGSPDGGSPDGVDHVAADGAGEFKLALGSAADLSGYAWLRLDVHDDQSQIGFDVSLEDADGQVWTMSTHRILTYARYPVYVSLAKAAGIDLSGIVSVTVHGEGRDGLSVLQVSATDDASEAWRPFEEP